MIVVPSKMGQLNKRALVMRLQKAGTASRAELARLLGMSQPTAGRIVEELLEAGVLEEIPEAPGISKDGKPYARLGRPGRLLRLESRRPRFLGVQLGVEETTLAALPLRNHSDDRWFAGFTTPSGAEDWVAQLRMATSTRRLDEYWGVLVSVPGIVDERAGRVLFSSNLRWTEQSDLRALVRQCWGLPALLVQEERTLALGHHATVPGDEDFLLVDFGEGVGAAVVLGGRLYPSPLPMSGELGHTPVLGNWRPCGCGSTGCVETLLSKKGLLQSFGLAQSQANPAWPTLVEHVEKDGVPGWLTEALTAGAMVISGALNLLGLRRVIITGSLTELSIGVTEQLTQLVVKSAMWARFGNVECVAAPRRRTAGMVAAGIDRFVISVADGSEPRQSPLSG